MNATLLCVAMLVPGYGEKEVLKGIRDAGGHYCGVRCVTMPRNATDADLGDLCERATSIACTLEASTLRTRVSGRCPICAG